MTQEDQDPKEKHDPRAELAAMTTVLEALDGLSGQSIQRVLAWAGSTLGVAMPQVGKRVAQATGAGGSKGSSAVVTPRESGVANGNAFGHEDLASFFAASGAKAGPDRALVAAYWLQVVDQKDPWSGADLNGELNHLGHKLANVTSTLSGLMKRKPQPVLQMSKGKSKKGRKAYKLSVAGTRAVSAMFEPADDGE